MKLLEFHIVQTVAPSNLNRDDTGSPKDAVFGGFRRARISSQAQKRAARVAFQGLLPGEDRAIRTKRLVEAIAKRLASRGRPVGEAAGAAEAALNAAGFGVKGGEDRVPPFPRPAGDKPPG